jgi:hypothetical protein
MSCSARLPVYVVMLAAFFPAHQAGILLLLLYLLGIVTAAVGLITEAKQAQAILDEGHADWIYLARVLLRDPYWPLHAAAELGRTEAVPTPPQYDRGWNALGKTKMAMPIANPMPRLG